MEVGLSTKNQETPTRQAQVTLDFKTEGFHHKVRGSMWALFKEFLKFCRQEKKWWLIPLIVVLLVLGAILIFTATSGIAWVMYPFM